MRCFRTARPSVGEAVSDDAIVAAVRCHWRRPEAWPARGQAVGRSLLQSAECAGRAVRLCASRCRWPDERFSVPLPPPFQYSLVGSHRTKSNEETQSGSWKIALSHDGVEMLANGGLSPLVQRRPQKGATSLQRIHLRKGSAPLPNEPCSHGKPLPGRRQPVKAASREAGARNAPALTGWRRSGLLASKQTRLSFRFTARAPACERTTSRLLHLAWRCRRCGGRYAVRARAATGRG